MILSNTHLLAAIDAGQIMVEGLVGRDISKPPFNTSAIDLRLSPDLIIPQPVSAAIQIDKPYDKDYVARNCTKHTLTVEQPYKLKPGHFVLGLTMEKVGFPITGEGPLFYAGRIEGKSSLARYWSDPRWG